MIKDNDILINVISNVLHDMEKWMKSFCPKKVLITPQLLNLSMFYPSQNLTLKCYINLWFIIYLSCFVPIKWLIIEDFIRLPVLLAASNKIARWWIIWELFYSSLMFSDLLDVLYHLEFLPFLVYFCATWILIMCLKCSSDFSF